ncbi:MAG: 3D domain-containing protein [Bacillota bacterium]
MLLVHRLRQKFKEIKAKGIVLVIAGLLMVISCFFFWPKQVTILAGDEVHFIKTRKIGVKAILYQAQITVQPEDLIAQTGSLWRGRVISVLKAIPVTIVDGEKEYTIKIPLPTEKEALRAAGIRLGPDDFVKISCLTGPEGPGLIMEVNRIRRAPLVERKELSFTTEYKPVDYLSAGTRRIVQEGHPGIEEVTWQVTYVNQKEVAREVLSSAIFKHPQNRVMAYGSPSPQNIAYRGQPPAEFRYELILEATGYTHTGNPTFTGIYPYRGIMAVDPEVIPLGTLMWVEGYGYARAADTGGVIKGNIIDLFFDTKEEALKWGRRQVKVFVVEPY